MISRLITLLLPCFILLASLWQPIQAQEIIPPEPEAATKSHIAHRLQTATQQLQLLKQERQALEQQEAESLRLMQQLQTQIEALKGSFLLTQLLYQQQQLLPDPAPLLFSDNEIVDWRIEQFEIREQLARSHNDADTLGKVLNTLEQMTSLAILNRGQHQQLSATLAQNHALITEQLFWMPSSRPLNLRWWQQLPQKLWHELEQAPFALTAKAILVGAKQHWFWLLLGGIATFLLRTYRSRWYAQLDAIQEQVGLVRYDRPLHTIHALVLSALICAPLPLLFLVSAIVWLPTHTNNAVLLALHWQYAVSLWLVLWARLILQDTGIAQRHFRWNSDLCQQIAHRLKAFSLLLIPLLWCIQLGFKQPASLLNNPAAPLVFIICCIFLATLLWRPLPRGQEKLPLRQVVTSVALIAAPLAMAAASLLGYHFSAISLMQRALMSIAVIWLSILGYQAAWRALTVVARQLAHRRAILRRQYRQQKDDISDSHVDVNEDALEVDLYRLNGQATQLIRWSATFAAALMLYHLWADIIGTLSYLNQITLWQSGEDDRTTLGHALGALLILSASLVMARNLPALISVTLLSRLALKPGSSYTITALLTYALTASGVVWALAVVGVSWDKLQWLVAALGFGLGFGLQEIFANFVSGIILLFERPIRVGDYVTIGSYTGTVTRIRIRATTIRDNDKREVILPNKAFVTDRFTNWTLTDTTTRISIAVGFDYDADLEATKQLLLDAAHANPRVLKDPAPAALFTSFQASTLEHTLRVHVKVLSDRSRAIDELNRSITELARERGLSIAFNQLEISLKNIEGETLRLPQQLTQESSH